MRIFIFLLAFFCSSAFATQTPVPELPKYVNDLTDTLTNSEVNALTRQIKILAQEKQAQVVVLVVETTGDETIEQYATRVFDSWKPGDKNRDDGVLLLVAWQDHSVRIEIGYGLEGVITDAQSGQIIRKSIIPAFKNGDLAGGLQKGISDIESRLAGNNLATITPADHPLPFSGWWALLVWAIVLTFIAARGYVKTLGLICFVAIVLAFVLPIAGFSGSWGVLITLLCFATPFLAVAIAFTPFGKKVRDSMRNANQPSREGRSRSSSWHSSSSSSSSSSFDNDHFSGGGGSSGGGGASGRW
ncbi:TPM domain-containing protein [Escherichia albertii]|nr:YgcG family protein [Escherichia albertii]EJQ6147506.1 YgcG family protein [Escherichia albertii]MCE7710433.1 YgcG family protein [Escherichia albertii]HBM9791974.1 YgcG family protein [Escherichia albertii]